jgi:hypothetical protein
MPIEVVCRCGKRFFAKDEWAGRTGLCPACMQEFVVPLPVVLESVNPQVAVEATPAVETSRTDPNESELFRPTQ